MNRRNFIQAGAAGLLASSAFAQEKPKVTKYCRFQAGERAAYGLIEGDQVRQLDGDLFATWKTTEMTRPLSARDWQKGDLQWWRAKGSDSFGPVGPIIVSGSNYDDLLLQLRLNGQVAQKQRTSDLLHNCAAIVSWISQHVTLEPGDLIYTGTPGKTSAMKAGDTVEVELEGVGVLRNKVV